MKQQLRSTMAFLASAIGSFFYSVAEKAHDALFAFLVDQGLVKCIRYSANWTSITAAAVADHATAFTAGQAYGFLRTNASAVPQLLKLNEVYLGGEDSASTPTTAILGRGQTLSVGALSVGQLVTTDATASVITNAPSFGNTAATSYPTRSATGYLLNLSLNTYGGIARWQARYGEEITVYGTATATEVIMSSKTGTGKTSGHILFEVA